MIQHTSRAALNAFLLLAAFAVAARPAPKLAPVFASVVPELKQETRIPILLPDHLPPLDKDTVYATAEGDAQGYAIRLESDPDCDHAQVCFLGMFRAKKGGAFSFPQTVRIGKTSGRFKPTTCGGSCSPPAIEWKSAGVLYTAQLDLATRSDKESKALLTKLAEDALVRGPR